jgi:hypothetical protein
MGILFNTVATLPVLKRNHIIERLLEKGITKTKDGISIYDLDYRDLKLELSKADFREINAESDSNKWF